MKNQEQLLKIIARIRVTLTEAYGEKFTALAESDKHNIMICVLHDLAKRDKKIMDVTALAMWEMAQ